MQIHHSQEKREKIEGPLTFQGQLNDLYHVWESNLSFVLDRIRGKGKKSAW
jgi:hypothetical protein